MPGIVRTMISSAIICLSAAMPVPAKAQSAGYVGTWASTPAQCRVGQGLQNAPLILKKNSYDQHEVHCKFASVNKRGQSWAVKARCTVEGNAQTLDFVLRVSGSRLSIRDNAGVRTLLRCR